MPSGAHTIGRYLAVESVWEFSPIYTESCCIFPHTFEFESSWKVDFGPLPICFGIGNLLKKWLICLKVLVIFASLQGQTFKIAHRISKILIEKGQPKLRAVFAGGLAYSKYNLLVKWWMRRISKKSGGDTDTTHDCEYTDWNADGGFAKKFSKKLYADLGSQSGRREKTNNGTNYSAQIEWH